MCVSAHSTHSTHSTSAGSVVALGHITRLAVNQVTRWLIAYYDPTVNKTVLLMYQPIYYCVHAPVCRVCRLHGAMLWFNLPSTSSVVLCCLFKSLLFSCFSINAGARLLTYLDQFRLCVLSQNVQYITFHSVKPLRRLCIYENMIIELYPITVRNLLTTIIQFSLERVAVLSTRFIDK